jgi:hypothetical protein
MRRLLGILACLIACAAPALIATPAHAAGPFVCRGFFKGGTYHNVVIPDGAQCIIKDATITGGVRTKGAPRVVRILDTDIARNIKIRNVTREVTIGAAGCEVDPMVGNNLMVRNSRNVAVCQMSVRNNLKLSKNTGRMMVRDNRVCGNVRVVGNHLKALRVARNRYAGNFTVARNTWVERNVVRKNVDLRINPGACRA